MERPRNDPEYQIHEPEEPQEEPKRLSADEVRERSVEEENSSRAVHRRQNMNQAPPSEVRKAPHQG